MPTGTVNRHRKRLCSCADAQELIVRSVARRRAADTMNAMGCTWQTVTGVRIAAALALAAVTLATPVCPALALDEHECCCAHDAGEAPQHEVIETPPCGCAEPDRNAQRDGEPAAGAVGAALEIPGAVASPQAILTRPPSAEPAPAVVLARPPPELVHIQTVVLRR